MKRLFHIVSLVGLLLPCLVQGQDLYKLNSIQRIELFLPYSDWDYRLDTAKAGNESYLMGSVKINGVLLDSVGVKYKGNSSYNKNNKKNPFHIELNTYKEQHYQGYTDVKLSNAYGDPSLFREVLAYELAGRYMDCPLAAPALLYINDTLVGLYSSAESINNAFVERQLDVQDKTFIKCNPNGTPGPSVKSNLKYLGDDSSAYFPYYELKSDAGWNKLTEFCRKIRYADSLEKVTDIEAVLWMLAFNNLFINLDSYTGVFAQNYYLAENAEGKLLPILWDVNMCFGSFPYAGSPGNGMGSLTVTNMQQFSPTYHATHADWPLIQTVLSDAGLKKRYLAHYRAMAEEFLANSKLDTLASQLQTQLNDIAKLDSFKFFSNTQFDNALESPVTFGSYQVPGIVSLMRNRFSWLKTQAEFTTTQPVILSPDFKYISLEKGSSINLRVSAVGASSLVLYYRMKERASFNRLVLFDDGAHDDVDAGDGIFAVQFSSLGEGMQYYLLSESSEAAYYWPLAAPKQYALLGSQPQLLEKGRVFVNEILASNNKSDINDFGIYSDWVELYNASTDTLSLYGSYLSNKIGFPKRYAFPANAKINPKSYLVVWADELTEDRRYLHANFSLSASGDQVYLVNKEGVFLDSIYFNSQLPDVSYGRCPDGTGSFVRIDKPTFWESNSFFCVNALPKHQADFQLNYWPNPAKDELNLSCEQLSNFLAEVYNLNGTRIGIFENAGNNLKIDFSGLPEGIYLVRIPSINKSIRIVHYE